MSKVHSEEFIRSKEKTKGRSQRFPVLRRFERFDLLFEESVLNPFLTTLRTIVIKKIKKRFT